MVRVLRLLRWILFFEGWLLLAAPAAIIQWLNRLAALLPTSTPWSLDSYLTWFTVASWAAGALCLATFWGMGAQKPWVRITGLAVSLFNLAIFPPLGLTGLVAMRRFTRYNMPEEADANALVEETRMVRIGRITAALILLVAGYRWIDSFAEQLGTAGPGFGWRTILLLLCGQFLVALIHEIGHTLVALAFGFRFPVFRIGPWAWSAPEPEKPRAIAVQFERLFAHDSYLAGFPGNPVNVRWSLIAVALAGPLVSLLLAFCLFLGMLTTPGTAVAGDTQFLGILSLLFGLDFSLQILPFGYSDGRIVVDLLSNNHRGRNMVLQMTAAAVPEHQTTAGLANFAVHMLGAVRDPIHALRERLNLLLRRGVIGGVDIAQAYQELGVAELMTGQYAAAQEHLERSLEHLNAFPQPERHAVPWLWLEKLYRYQQRGVESHYAYGRAVQYWEAAKTKASRMNDVFEARVALANLHAGQGEYGSCVEELEEAEPHRPRDKAYLLTVGRFHQASAISGFRLRWAERARTHAFAAARAYTHKNLPPTRRALGLLHLGDLALELWHAGQSMLAVEFATEAMNALADSDAGSWLRLQTAEVLAKTGHATEALDILNAMEQTDPDQEMRIASILGWAALLSGRHLDAAEYFDAAAATLDPREKARQEVAQARALLHAGRTANAIAIARGTCDVLMREEHGEAGMALLLIASDEFRCDPQLTGHPFFDEGCRIVRAARFMPPPDKWIGLRDVLSHYERLGRKLEAGEIRQEMQRLEAQMSWDWAVATMPLAKSS
jgi:tetratricopeptide (TPR) repeat protein